MNDACGNTVTGEEFFSCEWIEERLVLDRRDLKFCCLPHSNNTKGFVPVCAYEGGPLPLEEIRASRARLVAANNREGVDSPCKGCHFLVKKHWPRRPETGWCRQVEISSYSICNLRCVYCYTVLEDPGGLSAQGYDLRPAFEDLIGKGQFAPDATVGWGGGEPTALKEFEPVARMLMAAGVRQRIFTNAVRHSEVIEEGLRRGLMGITTSIDAGTRETYAKVKGRDRLERVWRNLERYARTGGEITAKYIVRGDNADPRNVRSFVRKCVEIGIRDIAATPDLHEVAARGITEETAYGFAVLSHEIKKRGLWPKIGDEYLNPEHKAQVGRYMPWLLKGWRYQLARARKSVGEGTRRARVAARGLLHGGAVRRAVREAEACLGAESCDPHTVAGLLRLQTSVPHPRLHRRLVALLREKTLADKKVRGRVTTVGLAADDWTVDERPGYVLVEGAEAEADAGSALWLACWAPDVELPLTVTISDGTERDIVHTFRRAERIRVELPPVPAGAAKIFSITTDKAWSPGTEDRRRLGVHVATRPG